MKENGFIQLISEPCVFKKVKNGKISCIVGLYIDDMIITGNDNNIKETIKAIIYKYKNFKKCNPIDFILGINVENQRYNYSISQKAYIEELLTKFNVANTRKTKTYYLYNRKKLKFKIYFQNLFSCCITFHYLISL